MRINLSFLYRKKKYDASSVETTNLHRVLNLSDLSALGIASTLGPGVYVLIGNIIAKYTGPSIVLSFLIAGVCSFLAGLCYAELGSRVPRSGSAYIYIYVTIGEFLAFFIGWNVILEYIIGTSAGASALSQYIDALSDFQISKAMRAAMPMNLPGIAPYPDFLAFGMLLIIIFMLILGVKDSSMLNIIFTGANLAIVVFIVIVGTIESDPGNWFLDVYPNMSYTDMMGQNTTCALSNRCGSGGFTPFGAEGIIKGAAKCFYAYIGFDVIATSGEEVLDPKRTIPLSIVTTLIVVSLCYVLVSTTVSLMLPYYVYDPSSPLSEAFRYVGFQWASYVISVGAIISLATSLYAAMFPMPRVVYAMASDGLLFRQLDYVTPLFKTPLFACILTGLLSALLVLIFDLNQLVDMMSFGTLLAYSLVSVCTLILRYRPHEDYSHTVTVSQNGNGVATTETASNGSSETQQDTQQEVVRKTWIGSIFGHSNEPLWKRIFMPTSIKPTKATSKLVNALTFIEVIDILVICAITNLGNLGYAAAFAFFIIFLIIFVIIAFLIWLQPTDDKITTFKVPLVPFFPLCSAFINIFLMTSLNSATWIRFLVWFAIGFFVYFGYGIRYSHENKQGPHQNWLCPCFEKSYTTMEDTESVIPNSTIINDNESTV